MTDILDRLSADIHNELTAPRFVVTMGLAKQEIEALRRRVRELEEAARATPPPKPLTRKDPRARKLLVKWRQDERYGRSKRKIMDFHNRIRWRGVYPWAGPKLERTVALERARAERLSGGIRLP